MRISQISPEQTYELRHHILRPNQTIQECQYPADHEKNAFHLGAFIEDKLISIASFYHEYHPDIQAEEQYRLRGMATHADFRLQQAGTKLIQKAENLLTDRKAEALWCNARITVSDYYKKLGFHEVGDVFDIHPIGPHRVMVKPLKPLESYTRNE